jgi:basic membrane protein A
LHKRPIRLLAGLLALGLLTAACGGDDDDAKTSDTTTDDGGAKSDFQACQVTDTGGVDDRSFNENAFKGLSDAGDEVGFEAKVLESQSDADYAPNIDAQVEQGCDLIITVGFLLGDATEAAAAANPDTEFAIVDYAYDEPHDNILGLTFSTDQAAYLAGYLAAGMTKTGKIGTYGGLQIPSVTIFMKGMEAGIDRYNEDNGTDVSLLGWKTADDSGLFTGDFEDQSKGRQTTESLLDQGADIIMPVAGPVGLGTLEAVKAAGGDTRVIWVDTDGCESVPDSCSLFLSSVQKRMDVAVHDATVDASEGKFAGGVYSGTLKNGGVALAPYHEFDDEVPQELKDKIDDLKQQIIDGEIDVAAG